LATSTKLWSEQSFLGHASQRALPVLSAVENPNDHRLGSVRFKNDRGSPLKAYDPQSGADVVTPCAALRKGFERFASASIRSM
jgi:hypothetical protein